MSDEWQDMKNRTVMSDPDAKAEYERLRAREKLLGRIIAARIERGWSQRELANAAGMKQPAIARLEGGETDPRWSTIVKVCDALELPLVVGSDSEQLAG